jgi:hypothetical protein
LNAWIDLSLALLRLNVAVRVVQVDEGVRVAFAQHETDARVPALLHRFTHRLKVFHVSGLLWLALCPVAAL